MACVDDVLLELFTYVGRSISLLASSNTSLRSVPLLIIVFCNVGCVIKIVGVSSLSFSKLLTDGLISVVIGVLDGFTMTATSSELSTSDVGSLLLLLEKEDEKVEDAFEAERRTFALFTLATLVIVWALFVDDSWLVVTLVLMVVVAVVVLFNVALLLLILEISVELGVVVGAG